MTRTQLAAPALASLVVVTMAVVANGCAQPEPIAPAKISANQEPVALLALSANAIAGASVAIDASQSLDVDGSIASATIEFGDDTPSITLDASMKTQHAWATAGLFDVDLAVTDDHGLVGRARTRITIAPAPDANPPAVTSIELSANGAALAADARVAPGTSLVVSVRASDAEANLDHVSITVGSSPPVSVPLAGSDAAGSMTISAEGAGDVSITAIAFDLAGNQSPPMTTTIHVIGPDDDTDGDGIPDLQDSAPDVFNGLSASVFHIDGVDDDFLGNPEAEKVCSDISAKTPDATFNASTGYLNASSSSSSLTSLFADAPDVSTNFAIKFDGVLVPPEGAQQVVVDVSADAMAVVFLGGTPVASSNSLYATDFLRLKRVPSTSAPVTLTPAMPVEIVVADGSDPYSWAVHFTFSDAGGTTVLDPASVDQHEFEVLP